MKRCRQQKFRQTKKSLKMNKFCILLFAFLLGGCVLKPYKAPTAHSLKMDSLYREAVDSSRNISQIPWRDFFENSTLCILIDSVLAKNLDLKVAVARIEQSYSQLRSSRAAIAPSFNAGVAYGGNMGFGGGGISTDMALSANLGMSWEIDIWGKLASAKNSAKASFWQSQDAYQAVHCSLIAQSATLYYQLVALDARRTMILETIDNRTAYLATTISLKDAGKVNEVAVQQAKSQLEEVRVALSVVEQNISQTENAVSLLMGEYSGPVKRVADTTFVSRKLDQVGYPAQLLAFRPDVRASEMNYRAKHELWNVARASLYPSLAISATGNMTDIISGHSLVLNLLGGLTQPIFNGRKLRAQKEIAQKEAEIAELEFRKTVLIAAAEVNNSLTSVIKTGEQTRTQMRQLEALEKAYEYSEELFVNGYATYLDVLVAQTGVFTVQMSLIDTYLANLTARIELYRALGGGVR